MEGLPVSGMCARCRNDAALPNSDFCRACENDQDTVRHTAEVIQLTARCQFGTPFCTPAHPCGDCVEFASYGGSAA